MIEITKKELRKIADGMLYIKEAVIKGAVREEYRKGYNAGVMDLADAINKVLNLK